MSKSVDVYKILYQATKVIHQINTDEEVYVFLLETTKELLHTESVEVWSSEEHATGHPLINELNFQQAPENISEVFASGVLVSKEINERETELAFPIMGQQGIYGVLVITLKQQVEEWKSIFQLLCEEAGKAIEKIKLYTQSKRKIKELQMLNDFILTLNTSLSFSASLSLLKEHFIADFHFKEVGFFFKNNEQKYEMSSESTVFFHTGKSESYKEYVQEHFLHNKTSMFIGNAHDKLLLEQSPFYTVLMFPFLDGDELIGYTTLLHPEKYAYEWELFKNIETLIFHSSLAITNALLKEELERLAMTDPLTHLFSRRYLNEKIEKSIKEDCEGTFIIIDIDNFKDVNDRYGHQVGDNVLVQIAQHIQKNIRKHDIGARWGGEELAIYLPKTSLESGFMVAERIVNTVSDATDPSITVSCGLSYWENSENKTNFRRLFELADQALYQAKRLGKNKIIVHT